MLLGSRTFWIGVAVSTAVAAGSAAAESGDDGSGGEPTDEPPTQEGPPVEYGIGVRVRNVRIPGGQLEWFVEHSPGGTSNVGLGVELTRRRGNTELQLGFEYEAISVPQGVWIAKGDNVAAGHEADYILSADASGKTLGWITAEFTFFHHTMFTPQIGLRLGIGGGLGILTGELQRYDVLCNGATNATPVPGCVPPQFQGTGTVTGGPTAYNLPPVFPVLNAIAGVQFRPLDKLTVNLEGGIRTMLFFGVSSSYFF